MMHEKIILVKNIETENFSIAIDWELIEHQSSQANLNQKILIAISIDLKTGSIDRKSGKIRILKNRAF